MTIYGKGCISNYRNCSLSYVWYSVLGRMLTVIPILHELYTIHHKGEWSTLLERLTDFSAVLHGDILPSRHHSFDGIPYDEATLLDRMFRYYRNLLSKDR